MNQSDQAIEKMRRVSNELRKAPSRVGVGLKKRAKWLLGLASQNPAVLDQAAWQALRYELAYFAANPYPDNERAPFLMAKYMPWSPDAFLSDDPCLPSQEHVKDAINATRWHIEEIVSQRKTVFPDTSLKFTVRVRELVTQAVRKTRGRAGKGVREKAVLVGEETATADGGWGAFKYALKCLLVQAGPSLRRCPTCDTVFYSARADKRFCGDNCRATWHNREQRGTVPENYGKRGRPRKDQLQTPKIKEVRNGTKRRG